MFGVIGDRRPCSDAHTASVARPTRRYSWARRRQHCLRLRPLPHGHGAFRPLFAMAQSYDYLRMANARLGAGVMSPTTRIPTSSPACETAPVSSPARPNANDAERLAFAIPPIDDPVRTRSIPSPSIPRDPDDRALPIRAAHPELDAAITDGRETAVVEGQEINPRLHLAIHEVVANQLTGRGSAGGGRLRNACASYCMTTTRYCTCSVRRCRASCGRRCKDVAATTTRHTSRPWMRCPTRGSASGRAIRRCR